MLVRLRKSTCSVLQRGHIYDQVAFHSELNSFLNLPSVSVACLPWEISKSNRLLISPYLFSTSVENWLSRGVWHRAVLEEEGGEGGVIHCWSKACLNVHLQFCQERSLKRESLFHLSFMCVIWKMLLQLRSSSANYPQCLQRPQLQLAEVPEEGWPGMLQGSMHYFNLLAFCIKPQKHCHWQLIWCKFLPCLLGFSFRQ